VLGLGSEARMNIPGTMTGNWRWRLQPGQLTETVMRRLLLATQSARRNAVPGEPV
jgi:4-alpha-glucanotransferase